MNKFKGATAVVTGAGSGIGEQLSIQLAKLGAQLAIADINADALAQTEQQLLAMGASVKATVLDVADKNAVFDFARDTQTHFEKINLVFNNAGVAMSSGTLWETSIDDFEWLMRVNFFGVLYGTKAFLPIMEQADWGHIVNISSLFGLIGVADQSHYNASKFAVRGMTEALRQELELANSHISCTSVHPGGIKTGIARHARVVKEPNSQTQIIQDNFEDVAGTTAESAALQILNAVVKNKRRLLIGSDAKFLDWCQRHFPNHYHKIYQWFATRALSKYQK